MAYLLQLACAMVIGYNHQCCHKSPNQAWRVLHQEEFGFIYKVTKVLSLWEANYKMVSWVLKTDRNRVSPERFRAHCPNTGAFGLLEAIAVGFLDFKGCHREDGAF